MAMKRSGISQFWASILANSIYALGNYPAMMVSMFLTPFSILVVIFFVSHGTLLTVAIEGGLIMTMITSGMSLQTDLSHLKNDFKLQDMVVASPTGAGMYLFGMAISELVYSIPAIVVLAVLAILFTHLTALAWLILIAVMLAMFAFSTCLGFFISTFTSDVMESWAYTSIISTILSALPPVYYPITYIPMPFRYVAYLSPATYAAEIIQGASGFLELSSLSAAADWIVVIAITIIIGFVAVKKSRWREE
jgi:ABC-2 type transport system permease protein